MRFGSPERGQPPSALTRDERLQALVDDSRLLLQPGQFLGLA